MKSLKKLSICAAIALLAAGCAKEGSEFSGRNVQRYFTAVLDEASTKTGIDDAGKISWSTGDVITYFGSDAVQGTHTVSEDGVSTVISATLEATETVFTAVYGASEISNIEAESFTLGGVVPSEQDGTFSKANVSVARTTDLESGRLAFKNLTSMVKFSLNRTDIDHVIFSSASGVPLTADGSVNVTFDSEGLPVATLGSVRGTSIKVSKPSSGPWYISLLPGTYSGGFTIRCFDENNVRLGVASSEKTLALPRSTIVDLGTLDVDKRIVADPEDLAAVSGVNETANCYIAPQVSKDYKFNASVQGNSKHPLDGTPVSAEVLWESTNTGASCAVGAIVDNVYFEDGFVYLTAVSAGSAIVAVRDADSKILWSWHIWVWPNYTIAGAMQEYFNKAGYMMDRNLGAVSVTPGDRSSWGLLYQWGRKDPFCGGITVPIGTTYESAVVCSAETGTLEYATSNPTTIIAYSSTAIGDWLYEQDDTLWDADVKTKYDPCPPGWHIPSADFWATALNRTTSLYKEFDASVGGMNFAGQLGNYPSIWYPAGGYRTGNIQYAVYPQGAYESGQWWSAGTNGRKAINFAVLRTSQVTVKGTQGLRANGCSIRCVTNYETPPVPVTSVTVSPKSISIVRFKSAQLGHSVLPDGADDPSVTWSTNAPNIATVTQDGYVTAVAVGEAVITVTSNANQSLFDTCTVTVTEEQEETLNDSGPANCYVISTPGTYKFRTVMGNSDISVGEPDGAVLLWETFGTASYNSRTPVVEYDSIEYSGGYVSFEVPPAYHNGNAVIGVFKDVAGGTPGVFDFDHDQILWSWHIWVCGGYYPLSSAQTYKDGSKVMDRNLGATSADKGEVGAIGLYYQWGRKDPFPGPSTLTGGSQARVSDSLEDPVSVSPTTGTVAYATAHPTAFITSDNSVNDWMYTPDPTLWGAEKTIYDPCPAGWKVPVGGPEGLWAKAAGLDENTVYSMYEIPWESNTSAGYYGCNYTGIFGSAPMIWYPATGFRHRATGNITNYMMYASFWSSTASGRRSFNLYQYVNGTSSLGGMAQMASTTDRAFALAVRCVHE